MFSAAECKKEIRFSFGAHTGIRLDSERINVNPGVTVMDSF